MMNTLILDTVLNLNTGFNFRLKIRHAASLALSSDAIRPNKNTHEVVVNNDRIMSTAGVDYRYGASW
ncbi:hypothetical protein ACED29_20260 [Shewanella sp. 5S214]|uniref:hypothetical protein n=1 Tax=Shewanella sp. 5S214 TaxID=3229999 RepID=UPI00352E0887